MHIPPKIKLTQRQHACLQQMARRRTNSYRLVTRARIILEIDAGTSHSAMARQLGLDRGTVLYWRDRWLEHSGQMAEVEAEASDDKALGAFIQAALSDQPRPGAPSSFSPEQLCQIMAVACEDPASSDRPISHWTPRELADEVQKRGIVERISARSVGRFLKSGRFEAAQS